MNWLDWAVVAVLCWGIIYGYSQGKKALWWAVLLLPAGILLSLGFKPLISAFMEQAWSVSYRVESVVAPMFYLPVGGGSGEAAAVFSHMGLPDAVLIPVLSVGGPTPAAMISRTFVSYLALAIGSLLFFTVLKTVFNLVLLPVNGKAGKGRIDKGLGSLGGALLGLAAAVFPMGIFIPLVPLWPMLNQSLFLKPLMEIMTFLMIEM